MHMLYTSAGANSRLNPEESHSLVDGSFLLTDSFSKKSICLVWQVCDAPLWTLS